MSKIYLGFISQNYFITGNINGDKYLDMLYQEIVRQLNISYGNGFDRTLWAPDAEDEPRRSVCWGSAIA